MFNRTLSTTFFVILCGAVFTACKQESVAQKLQRSLLQANIQATAYFNYNPDLQLAPTKAAENDLITVAAHGYGANYKTGLNVATYAPLTGHVLTFNLPDYDCQKRQVPVLTHGTINELLPYLYALKVALDAGAKQLNLYGFSAGGGVVINTLGVLTSDRFDAELATIGITSHVKQAIMHAIEQGVVLLDVPLKSMEEIIKGRGASPELVFIAKQYATNNLVPLETIKRLHDLKLHIVVYFENPDEIIYNFEDAAYASALKQANAHGTTTIVSGSHGGHTTWHNELWDEYRKLTN